MADIVEIAKAKREQLAAELAEIESFIRTAESLLSEAPNPSATAIKAPRKRVRRGRSISEATVSAVRDALNEFNRPIPISNLVQIVREKGVEVGGKDASATLSARLSNSGEFQSHRGVGWWFKNRDFPSANRSIFEAGVNHPSKEVTPASDLVTEGGE